MTELIDRALRCLFSLSPSASATMRNTLGCEQRQPEDGWPTPVSDRSVRGTVWRGDEPATERYGVHVMGRMGVTCMSISALEAVGEEELRRSRREHHLEKLGCRSPRRVGQTGQEIVRRVRAQREACQCGLR